MSTKKRLFFLFYIYNIKIYILITIIKNKMLEKILNKYNINQQDLNNIFELAENGGTLKDVSLLFDNRFSLEQIYAIFKITCEKQYDLNVKDVAPQFYIEREKILEKNKDKIAEKARKVAREKKIKKIQEDLMYLKMEQKK